MVDQYCVRETVLREQRPLRLSPVVVKVRMRPGHWLGSVLCVPFSSSTPMFGLQEEYLVPFIPWFSMHGLLPVLESPLISPDFQGLGSL